MNKNKRIIFIVIIILVTCTGIGAFFIFKDRFTKKFCTELNGKICINNASQTCDNAQWVDASDTDFCCASQCITNPVCSSPQDCACSINPKKDAVAVIIKQNGELDTPIVTNAIENYLAEASNHTKKKSIGLKKFAGDTKGELANFIKNLYHNQGLGSFILVGRDLPIFDDLGGTILLSDEFVSNLSFIDRSIDIPVGLFSECKDIAISYIIPRYYDTSGTLLYAYSAIDFVKNTFQNFADYHADRDGKRSLFKKESLVLRWDDACGEGFVSPSQQSVFPESKILNTQHNTLKKMLSQKFAFLDIGVHGSESIQGLGLTITDYPDDKNCSLIYTSLNDFEQYSRNNPGQFLLVGISACGSLNIGRPRFPNCCFPQQYLESGAWSYSALGGSEDDIRKAFNLALSGRTLSDGVRRNLIQANIFGDILSGL